jgi:hypothetical protein
MRLHVIALLAAVLLPLPAFADTTTYTYTGNTFNDGNLLTDSVSGEFTVAAPLPDNTTNFFTPISFSFSNGQQTITDKSSLAGESFEITTGSSGNVLMWEIFVGDQSGVVIDTANNLDEGQADESVVPIGGSGAIFNDPGTWAITTNSSVTPEPASLSLILTGLAGAAAIGRRRLHAV